ncbi:MAG: hypothetical protein IJK58_05885 [Clostridia bacterium]|nr:hypothetical protein [Clostridia bacterium]
MSWLDRFSEPDKKYRSVPFWSWNDLLDEDEIRRQVRDMARAGHGGFFMHARDGLLTPYLSDKWFSAIRAAAEEAGRVGIRAWCYDEDGWPSGSAGGAVTAAHPEHSVGWLRMRDPDDTGGGSVHGTFAVAADGSFREIKDASEANDGERALCAVSFTGDEYIDVLDPDAVGTFVEFTHERYAREVGDLFRQDLIGGFFTDEPQYALCRVPWSKISEAEFEKRNGYSIREKIPALFFDGPGAEKVRFDWWRMVNDLYADSFAGTLYDWCERHGVKLTGHAMMEDNLLCQMHCTGGVMPFYEFEHIPGIDWLGRLPGSERITGRLCFPLVPLQLGSVAAQLGKENAISETFALAGWDVSFAEMKWLADWQITYGVGVFCEHLEGYTIRGIRKADYPPSIFYQSPWWDDIRLFTDTVAREGMLMNEGVWDPGVLLIHPIHSAWLKFNGTDINADQDYDDAFNLTVGALADAHVDFHLGDERLIARHGEVRNGAFAIGEREYGTVILPSLRGLDRRTYELLCEFKNKGGRIVVIGETPRYIEGLPAEDEIAELLGGATGCERDGIGEAASGIGIKCAEIGPEGGDGKFVHVTSRRYDEDGVTLFFLLNTTKEHRAVTFEADGAESAEILPDKATARKLISSRLEFAPMEMKIVAVTDNAGVIAADDAPAVKPETIKLPETWRIGEGTDKNSYMIESCRIRTKDGAVTEAEHAYLTGRKFFALEDRDGAFVEYSFTLADGLEQSVTDSIKIVTEFFPRVSVALNGKKLEPIPGEWWLDRSFTVYKAGDALKKGENIVSVTGLSSSDEDEIGYLYLTGDFGVYSSSPFVDAENRATVTDGPFVIGKKPKTVSGSNIIPCGLAFFRGKLILEGEFTVDGTADAYGVRFDDPRAALIKVYVNGSYAGIAAWGDLTVDVTDFVLPGENAIALEVVVGNRNLLGPHHARHAEPMSVGPGDFYPFDPSEMKKSFAFVRSGL